MEVGVGVRAGELPHADNKIPQNMIIDNPFIFPPLCPASKRILKLPFSLLEPHTKMH
jgi:hypothetical protein